MGSADQASEGYAAVFFMSGAQVSRQMRDSEFGAFLDGYVGLSDLADTDVKAVYVTLSDELLIQAMVFFRIYFDEEGRADSHWNLPIEEMAKAGAKGPDLGGGPIRLVCRSQCPAKGVADDLWDPDMSPGQNQFNAIRKAVEANSLKFQKKVEVVPEVDIPVLQAEPAAPPAAPDQNAERTRLAQLLREHRLRIKTLQSVHRDALADTRREHRLDLKAAQNEIAELEQKDERLRLSNEQLKKRLAERNEQYLILQEQLAHSNEVAEQDTQTRSAEAVLLAEQLERKQRELEMRDEKIVALEQELHELRNREPPEQTVLKELQEQSVFLVAYHAGMGHMTLPYEDIEAYFQNPTAYAADKCGLNEPAYLEWLQHYENPVCRHQNENGDDCGEPVMRVSQPSEFQPGRDDRCESHRPVS
ncbi:DNA repair protein [Marinobacter sp. SS21]|uniref:DNA repair protein n=1 Tax=Marinobacter sp. SS21 TaxID=2979460 RepID=UPI00232AF30F|nr:DNA repair protein [Marinobacter sp. SS21]MDC0663786.1 DNA repair protein [Marinobacter sp. SS21]